MSVIGLPTHNVAIPVINVGNSANIFYPYTYPYPYLNLLNTFLNFIVSAKYGPISLTFKLNIFKFQGNIVFHKHKCLSFHT